MRPTPLLVPSSWVFSNSLRRCLREDVRLPRGYAPNRFVVQIPAEFLCPRCNAVVRLPVECAECGTLYCLTCAQAREHPFMPVSIPEALNCMQCRRAGVPKRLSRVLTHIIGGLQIECKYLQCGEVVRLDKLKAHEQVCLRRPVRCGRSKNCTRQGLLGEFLKVTSGTSSSFACQSLLFACSEHCKALLEFEGLLRSQNKMALLTKFAEILRQADSN